MATADYPASSLMKINHPRAVRGNNSNNYRLASEMLLLMSFINATLKVEDEEEEGERNKR